MAVTTTFKQECPTCGATVKVDDKMIGKKVECTKCKDKFVAERPEDEDDEAPRGKKRAGVNGKKPAKDEDDVEDVDVDEDEPVQTKAGKGKAGANGKARKSDDEDDDEPEGKAKGKSKKAGASNKLTIGLSLAVVGVLMLGVVLFFLLKKPKTDGGGGGRAPGGAVKKDDEGGDKPTTITPAENPKIEATTVPLNDAEIAKLSNLLPNETEYVYHLFFKELFGPSGSLHEAVFKTPGALDNATMTRKLGFSLASVDDAIRAERYSAPSWKFSVIHFKDALDERQLKAALNLKLAGVPIEGQMYYKMTDAHPVFDALGRFSFGIPNWYRTLEPRRADQPTFVRIHNAQTLIVGDEKPVVDFLKAKGQFPLLSARSAPPPVTAPAPGDNKGGDAAKPGGDKQPMPMPGVDGPGPGGDKMKKMIPGKGKNFPPLKGKGMPTPPGQSLEYRRGPSYAEFAPYRFENAPVSQAGYGQEILVQDVNGLAAKLPGTIWKGNEKPPSNFFTLTFAENPNLKITSDVFMVQDAPANWQVNSKGIVEITSPKIPGVTYQCELVAPGQFKVTGANSQTSWTFTAGQTGGAAVEPGAQAPKQDTAPGAPPAPGAAPGAGGPMVTRDDMYLTIRPALKAILDRMEARSADSQDKALMSSTVDMEASRIETNLPEFRDRVVRRPRQFWDITVMLNESTPRIRTLGMALIQRGETQRYQLRNEISCTQDSEAVALKKEIMETTSFSVAQFLKKLVKHEVRLPELPKKEVAKALPVDPKEKGKAPAKPAPINYSHMTVNQQGDKVDFLLELVLDNATLTHLNSITALTAGALRVEMEAAASKSLRHWLGKAGKTVADKGMSDRDVPPGRFPPGAFLRPKTPFHVDQEPRNRISWMASLLPYMGQQHLYNRLQFDQSWRDPVNWMAGNTIVPQFLDPSYPDYLRRVAIGELPLDFGATHYVGIAGIGLDAASYSRNDPGFVTKRGVFSNDGSATLDEIQKGRGLSNTMMMIQIPHDGATGVSPWIAGGGATLRGVPEKNSIAPFVLSRDKNDKPIEHQGKRGTFVLMADMSVRFVDQNVSDDVFKAMATVQGPAPESFNLGTNPSTPLVPAPDKGEDDIPVLKPLDKKPDAPVKPAGPTPTPEKKSTAAARHQGEGRVYDKEHKFSMVPPNGWQRGPNVPVPGVPAQPFLCFLGPKDTFTPNINVLEIPNDGTTLDAIAMQIKQILPASNRTIMDEGFVTIDGKRTFRISHKGPTPLNGKNIDMASLQYVVFCSNSRVMTITFSSAPGAFDGLRKVMDESALTAQVD